MEWLFLVSFGFVGYTYVIYPALAVLLGAWHERRRGRRTRAMVPQPVAVIIPAYNEAHCIADKVRNVLEANYPRHLLRVVVVSDGSSDATVQRARSINDPRVTVLELPGRQGKAAAINAGVAAAPTPVLIMTDAAELFDRQAIACLVEGLADPEVGAVSGELKFVDAHTGVSRDLGLYWRYEKAIRLAESRLGSMVGVSGAIYALRRACFRPLPTDTILDDVAIPFEVIAQGYRVRFEPRAQAYEQTTATLAQEFARKRRTLAGNYQLLLRYWRLLIPFASPIAVQFLSHKVFRLFVPYALLGVFAGSAFLPEPWRSLLLAVQLGFYGLAFAASRLGARARLPLFTFPYTFCALNWAAVVGSYYYFSGGQSARWEKAK